MSALDVTAWRHYKNEDKSVVCRIQVTYKDARRFKLLKNVFSQWMLCGEGFSPKTMETIKIFEKQFKDDTKWKTFLRGFPCKIIETTPNNKKRIYNARKAV